MKISDYAPRTGAIESYLSGTNLTGAEIGVDVGSHAESLLTHCSIEKLHLIDIWENPYCEGYCEGRLSRWKHKIVMNKGKSNEVVKSFGVGMLDFIYFDQLHDENSVAEDFSLWWPILRDGGVMSLRNYGEGNAGLKKAADEFVRGKKYKIESYLNEILIFK